MAKDIDWDFIRTEYEETTKSERLIATENGITHGAIQTRRKKDKESGREWARKKMNVVTDEKLTNSRRPVLKKHALRKIGEIKNELGDSYSVLDEPLVVAFAVNYQKWIEVQITLLTEPAIATSSKGTDYISPYENLAKMYENTFIKIAGQLGLSVASRKRLKIEPKSDTEETSLFDLANELDDELDV